MYFRFGGCHRESRPESPGRLRQRPSGISAGEVSGNAPGENLPGEKSEWSTNGRYRITYMRCLSKHSARTTTGIGRFLNRTRKISGSHLRKATVLSLSGSPVFAIVRNRADLLLTGTISSSCPRTANGNRGIRGNGQVNGVDPGLRVDVQGGHSEHCCLPRFLPQSACN
jgi:hypothetical protein